MLPKCAGVGRLLQVEVGEGKVFVNVGRGGSSTKEGRCTDGSFELAPLAVRPTGIEALPACDVNVDAEGTSDVVTSTRPSGKPISTENLRQSLDLCTLLHDGLKS